MCGRGEPGEGGTFQVSTTVASSARRTRMTPIAEELQLRLPPGFLSARNYYHLTGNRLVRAGEEDLNFFLREDLQVPAGAATGPALLVTAL